MRYKSTKLYGPEQGWSIAYRQWRADTHCRYLHGYAVAFKLTFSCDELDARNWCVDFGGLKPIKEVLASQFDHTLLVAADDPARETLAHLGQLGLAKVIVLEHLGSEKLAELVYTFIQDWLATDGGYGDRITLESVEVFETPTNSASYGI